MKVGNRPWAVYVEGELIGLFHTFKQARAATVAIQVARDYQSLARLDVCVVDFRDTSSHVANAT